MVFPYIGGGEHALCEVFGGGYDEAFYFGRYGDLAGGGGEEGWFTCTRRRSIMMFFMMCA